MKRLSLGLLILSGVATWFFLEYSSRPESTPEPPPAPSAIDLRLEGMSLSDKIASLMILRADGSTPEAFAEFVAVYKPGGIILMADNIPTDSSLLPNLTAAIRNSDQEFPLLVAIDEEGDTVKRINDDLFPGALSLKNLPSEETRKAFADRGELLKSYGITLNFGIVADVATDSNSFIYSRALGENYNGTSERVVAAIEASKNRTFSTLKHFPGHGATSGDSHISIPTSSKGLDDWKKSDALPFSAGIKAGADVVMFGHLLFPAVDDQPASLSPRWHEILAKDLGFKGVTITDDLVMLQNSGDSRFMDPVANAIAALKAGNTLLLFVANHPNNAGLAANPSAIIDGIVQAAEQDSGLKTIINQNAQKALEFRSKSISLQK